jgi:hypothetical protein
MALASASGTYCQAGWGCGECDAIALDIGCTFD